MRQLISVFLYVSLIWASPLDKKESIRINGTNGGRIFGGIPAYPAQFPFAAAITVQTSNSRFFCSGALVNNDWILTAGHCVYGAIQFSIQLGSVSLTASDPNRITLATSLYEVHPDFNPETLEHDVGLIKLRLPITFTDYIRTTDHLPTEPLLDDQNLVGIGWGAVNDQTTALSDELNQVVLATISNQECQVTYGNQITENMICVAGNFNEGTCIGDSGAPLLHILNSGNMVLVGISSFISGNGCESADPSGYTEVYPYAGWIRNTATIWD